MLYERAGSIQAQRMLQRSAVAAKAQPTDSRLSALVCTTTSMKSKTEDGNVKNEDLVLISLAGLLILGTIP
jgi:hypothetical protein